MSLWRRIGAVLLVGWVALAACSSPDPDSASDADPSSASDSATEAEADESADADVSADEDSDQDEAPAGDSDSVSDVDPDTPDADTEEATGADAEEATGGEAGSSTTIAPLRPAGEPSPTTISDEPKTSAYISRTSMAADAIGLTWSNTEGVVEYQLHRIPRTSDDEPELEAMTDGNRIHVADEGGRFTDESVAPGTEYWHGVRELSADGEITAHGWHPTAAIDDEEPPSAVDDITAVVESGEVLLTWSEPAENYKLHSYRVLRGVDGQPPERIAVTWRLDQRSFLDDNPPTSGEVVYQVVSMDFHWNESAPGSVTVDLS